MQPVETSLKTKWEILQITVTDNCNLLCRHCPKTQKVTRGYNSIETFKEYLSNFSPDDFEVLLLSDFGEPFLRKDILDILRYVKSRGFQKVRVVSNITLLNEPLVEAIVTEELLEEILISTEAASKDLFEWVRGAKFDAWLTNIKMINACKKKFASPFPRLIFNVTCFKENLRELPQIMDLAHKLEIAAVLYLHLGGVTTDSTQERFEGKVCSEDQRLDRIDKSLVLGVFREVQKKSMAYNIPVALPEDYFPLPVEETPTAEAPKKKAPACDFPYRWVQVSEDGDVYPCCQISKKFALGNLNKNSFEEIWDSENLSGFVKT